MKILLLGPQGSGKGTIGELLSERLNIPVISSGNLLRSMNPNHPRYQEIHNLIDEGNLAPQDFIADLIKDKLKELNAEDNFILDGWGRAMIDLSFFDPGFDCVILLTISRETSLKRLTNRRTCEKCGDVYNILSNPPKVENICDECGGKLVQREDDTPEAINERLDIYYTETQEVIDHFKKKGILVEVNAEDSIEEVFKKTLQVLGLD